VHREAVWISTIVAVSVASATARVDGDLAVHVEAGAGDTKNPAGHRDADAVGGELTDQPEPYFGRTFSRAK
jgi:hypothetical protein